MDEIAKIGKYVSQIDISNPRKYRLANIHNVYSIRLTHVRDFFLNTPGNLFEGPHSYFRADDPNYYRFGTKYQGLTFHQDRINNQNDDTDFFKWFDVTICLLFSYT